jgi:hypothetical protein
MWKRTEKNCTCGNKIDDPDVVPEARYTRLGYLLLFFISWSARPREIIFRCLHCGGIVARTKDQTELERYKDYSEVMKIKEMSQLKINYKKRDYETPINTNVVGETLAPQSAKSIEWSLVMFLSIIATLIITSVVLFLMSR